jgi:outer membrane protein
MQKFKLLAGVALCAMAMGAQAHKAGDMIVRFGAATLDPQDHSSNVELDRTDITSGGGANVDSDTQLGLTGVYMVTDNVGIELLAATPFTHSITANKELKGALGVSDLGDTKHLPPTLSVQYYFNNSSAITPYLGVGLNYTTFFDEDVDNGLEDTLGGQTDLELDDSWGLAAQAGIDVALDDRWMLNAAIWYIDIDTQANFTAPGGTRVDVDVDIDPLVYMVGLGYKF